MARALKRKPRLVADEDAVELLLFRILLQAEPMLGDLRTWLTVMLINLSSEVAHSNALSGVGFALSGVPARKKEFPISSFSEDFRNSLLLSSKGRTNFVLTLPERDAAATVRAMALLEVIRAARSEFPGFIGVVIAVAAVPAEWAFLHTVDGFVRAEPDKLCLHSSAVLALLATFIAPTVLTCSDEFDVLGAVGTANAPSEVVLGTWDYKTRLLAFHDPVALETLAHAQSISLSPLWFDGTWAAAHEMMSQLRPIAAPEAQCIYNACTEFFLAGLATQHNCPVVVLCKPPQLGTTAQR